MKKIYLILSIFVIFILLSPFIGNQLIEDILNQKIKELSSQNLILEKSVTHSSYLTTKKEFQFLYKESNQEILIGTDIQYSNLLFNKMVSIDIYPISFSKKRIKDKSLLVHLEYDVTTQNFIGHIRDVAQHYSLKNSIELSFTVLNATFKGKGKLDNPDFFHSKIEKFAVTVEENSQKIVLDIDNLLSSIKHNNATKREVSAKNSFDSLAFTIDSNKFQCKDFNYSVTFDELDKESLVTLQQSVQNDSNSIEKSLLQLASQGIHFSIDNFSVKDVIVKNRKLGGLALQSEMIVTKSDNFKLSDLSTEIQLQLSKKIFKQIAKSYPMVYLMQFYAKRVGEDYLFEIIFKDEKLRINGKGLSL